MIEVVKPGSEPAGFDAELLALCEEAYDETLGPYLAALCPVEHLVVRDGRDRLVSHVMWVDRWVQVGDDPPARAAYVELVATAPRARGNGFASALMAEFARRARSAYPFAALSPSVHGIYERLGWRLWRGPLFVRDESGHRTPTPDDEVMMLDWSNETMPRADEPLSIEWRPFEVW